MAQSNKFLALIIGALLASQLAFAGGAAEQSNVPLQPAAFVLRPAAGRTPLLARPLTQGAVFPQLPAPQSAEVQAFVSQPSKGLLGIHHEGALMMVSVSAQPQAISIPISGPGASKTAPVSRQFLADLRTRLRDGDTLGAHSALKALFEGARNGNGSVTDGPTGGPTGPNAAEEDWRRQTAQELEALLTTIENNYAPRTLKKETVGLDWPRLKQDLRASVQAIRTPRDYYIGVLPRLYGAFKDAHVSLHLPTNSQKTLPLEFSYSDGATFISYIDREQLPEDVFPASIGDELVRFDGQTPDELWQSLSRRLSVGNVQTDRTLATRAFTTRLEARGGLVPPADAAKLVIRSGGAEAEYAVAWKASGVTIQGGEPFGEPRNPQTPHVVEPDSFGVDQAAATPEQRLQRVLGKIHRLFNVSVSADRLLGSSEQAENSEGRRLALGEKEPFFQLPADFKEIKLPLLLRFLAPSNLLVGTFQSRGKTIGFVRLASHIPGENEVAIMASPLLLRYYVSILEERTDALLIDQTNNPGGLVLYVDWLASLLTTGDYSFKQMRFRVKPTQQWLRQYIEIHDALANDPELSQRLAPEDVERFKTEFMKNYQTVLDAYNRRADLSEPISLTIVSEFLEKIVDSLADQLPALKTMAAFQRFFNKKPYTKPMAIHINEVDFSGGDAFPAIMQDNGRATFIGTNTAGAGGSVGQFDNHMVNEFSYSLTQSLMVRADGHLIENKGVKPDLPLAPTVNDHKEGFSGYIARILAALGW